MHQSPLQKNSTARFSTGVLHHHHRRFVLYKLVINNKKYFYLKTMHSIWNWHAKWRWILIFSLWWTSFHLSMRLIVVALLKFYFVPKRNSFKKINFMNENVKIFKSPSTANNHKINYSLFKNLLSNGVIMHIIISQLQSLSCMHMAFKNH